MVATAVVASREDGAAAARIVSAAGASAVCVIQTMAVPPAFVATALAGLPRLPVVIWVAHRTGRLAEAFDHGGITADGATVGGPMLTSVLVREGRPVALAMGPLGDSSALARVAEELRLAAVAGGVAAARIGRVGAPIDGYDCVDADGERLRVATGIDLVEIPPDEVAERFGGIDAERVAATAAEIRARCLIRADAEDGLLDAARVALALEDLVAAHRLDAGALNCHVPEIRLGRPIALAPCLGLGRLTSRGVPWTCTGDVLTAVAMLLTTRLGGAALYHEIEAVDYATGTVVLANSGEHDLALAPGARPEIVRNRWFPDQPRSVCARMSPPSGPATLVGFAQIDAPERSYRFVAAEGEFTGESWPETGTTNAGFRFAGGNVTEAWPAWARSGVSHHSSATPGHLASAVAKVARHLGCESVTLGALSTRS